MRNSRGWLPLLLALAMAFAVGGCETDDDGDGTGGTGGTAGTGGTGGEGGEGGAGGAGGAGGEGGAAENTAALVGAQEVPPVATQAGGNVTWEFDGTTLSVAGTFQALGSELHEVAGSAAHVHQAAAGANGPIVFNLTTSGDAASGAFEGEQELTTEQVTAFEAGELYVNVHTVNYMNGELRAQLSDFAPPAFDQLYEITLSGAEEVPPVTTNATGVASISLLGNELGINGGFSQLGTVANNAHVHLGAVGVAGDVVLPVAFDASTTGTLTLLPTELTTEQLADYEAGNYYLNVHSTGNPDGEIRGQLVAPEP